MIRAGIDIYGTVLRYAEVERYEAQYQLLRLGSCEFDFDVIQALQEGDRPEHLEALSDALGDVFEGALARRLHVALHPPSCYSFFTPVPAEAAPEQRKKHLLEEAALLTRSTPPHPLRLTADPIYAETIDTGMSVEWYHVLALDERLHMQFDRVLRMLPPPQHRMMLSTHAVARVVEHIERQGDTATLHPDAPFSLVVGSFPSHLEYALCRHSRWYSSSFTEAAAPVDAGYFALALLQRLGLQAASVGRIFVYGEHTEDIVAASLTAVFNATPEPLNPMVLINLDAHSMDAHDHFQAYAACLGVAL